MSVSISIEVMDSANGRPAMGALVSLHREDSAEWHEQAVARTDELGRVTVAGDLTVPCRHRLAVDLDEYFAGFGIIPLQSRIEVTFRVFHPESAVRLLLTVTPSSCGTHAAVEECLGPSRRRSAEH